MKKWFDILNEKAKQSYSRLIVVNDLDKLGSDKLFLDLLSQNFAVVCFHGELSLRQFIRQHQSQQILILLQEEGLCLPFDIEHNSDLIKWNLADVFPRFDSKALRMFEMDGYQSIFNAYEEIADNIAFQDEKETLFLIREWIRNDKVIAQEKGYGGVANAEAVKQYTAIQETGNAELKYAQLVKDIRLLLEQDKIDWQVIARRWGELEYLHPAELLEAESYFELDNEISQLFHSFINQDYDQLFFASFKNGPVTINQTMRYLGTLDTNRIALLCFDGMGFSEWIGLKNYLKVNQFWNFNESATFALIPSLTSSSRTSLFSGEVLLDKMGSESAGFVKAVDKYFPNGKSASKQLFKNTDGKWNRDYLDHDMLGIVFDIIDSAGHKSILFSKSKKNMHHQLQELYGQTQIALTISTLLREGYRVFLTADHGSIWCSGNGVKAEKYLVEDRALRALIYPNIKLAEDFANKNDLILIQNPRILGDRALVLPRGRQMFNTKDKLGISHGGIHIEEVVIPFVEVLT
ncbi:MAG: PglZ domain-containing protein [Syntrophomonas sp.]